MSSSSIESKIQGLQARLMAENRSRDHDPALSLSDIPSRGSPRHGTSGHRPRILVEMPLGTPPRSRRLDLPVSALTTRSRESAETDIKLQEIMKQSGILTINGIKYQTEIKDMEHLGELGNGTCGHVVKMLHKPSREVIAVKQMRRTGNTEENKRIVMDIDVVYKSYDCPYIVQCLGCFIMESEVWICMELMATCFDKLLKRIKGPIPEDILGRVTVATVKALSYLKEKHDLIHRDVKPSNILLGEKGNVKLCDFGISGRLVDSKAKTKSAGCAAYMAPERIDPPDPTKPDYDIRADVWSLGITLVELALGTFPYQDCTTEFEVICRIMHDTPPALPNDRGFSPDFRSFVACCLTKNYQRRPKYPKLLEHPFIKRYETANVAVDLWFANIMKEDESTKAASGSITSTNTSNPVRRLTTTPPSPTARRNLSTLHPRIPSSEINGSASSVTPKQMTNGISSHNSRINSTFLTSQDQTTNSSLPPLGRNFYISSSRDKSSASPSRVNNSPPDRFTGGSPYLERAHFMNNSPPSNEGRFSPFCQRKFDSEPNTQPPINLHDSSGRFSPFGQRRITDSSLQSYPQDGRFSPFQQRRFGEGSSSASSSPYHQRSHVSDGFWQTPVGSPLPVRKRYQNIPVVDSAPQQSSQPYNLGNTSPIVLQRFYHQQNQLQKEQSNKDYQQYYYNNYLSGGSSASHSEDVSSKDDQGKKRFASYIKLQLNSDRRRTQSPDPPPRHSRGMTNTNFDPTQSPLVVRRAPLQVPCSASPNLSRRYISPSPPQPPPRRLTESSSVPGSPQHVRARFHYTPEPQRRLFCNNDLS